MSAAFVFAAEALFFFAGAFLEVDFALEAAGGAGFFFVDFLVERGVAALLTCLVFVRFAFLSTAILKVLGKVQEGLRTCALWSR
ncbi:MAG: hypothetical protein P1U86_09945 [Verrucomicrobiales bacterium]|nr:hypothetical protein [Verrucomicrobiales bacterium]